MVLVLMLVTLSGTPVFADEGASPDAGTPIAPIETAVPEENGTEVEPPTDDSQSPSESDVPPATATDEPAPAETELPDVEAPADAGDGDQPGTPVPDAEDENAASENVIPFAPELECGPGAGDESAVAGKRGWTVLECSLTWETDDIDEVRLSARPSKTGWEALLIESVAVDDDRLEQIFIERAESGEPILALTDPNESADGSDPFTSAEFMIGVRFDCFASLNTRLDLEIEAYSAGSEDAERGVHQATEEIEISGRAPALPELHDLALTFDPIANLLETRITTGSIAIRYTGAPATCGWSISFRFADFVAGRNSIAAGQLTATAVHGLDGVTVTSDQGVITVLIGQSQSPRDAEGTLEVSLELDVDALLPAGVYKTAVTMAVAISP